MSDKLIDLAKKVDDITKEQVKSWFSRLGREKQRKMVIPDKTLAIIKQSITEPEFHGFDFIESLITYQSALSGKKIPINAYVDAVRFCAFLESNGGNAVDAYIKTFIHTDFVKKRYPCNTDTAEYRELNSAVTRYRKRPLVLDIISQAEVPLYLMFQGYRYKAVNRLAKEMEEASLARDRINAADKLLQHLQPPEGLKIEVDVTNTKAEVIDTYEEMMSKMVAKKRQLMLEGGNIVEIANISTAKAKKL